MATVVARIRPPSRSWACGDHRPGTGLFAPAQRDNPAPPLLVAGETIPIGAVEVCWLGAARW